MTDTKELLVIIKAKELAKHTLFLTSNANRWEFVNADNRSELLQYRS